MSVKKLKNASVSVLITGIFLFSSFIQASAAGSTRIAILDFDANGTSKYAAKAVSEFVSTEMAKKSELTVIERKQIGAILNEQGFQQTGCTEQECAVEMGKLLSAKKIILGTLAKTGKAFILTAKSVDVETGQIDSAESERCLTEEDLELASKILAVKLVNKIAGTSYATPMRTYMQDESRKKYAVGFFYRYGIIKDVNVPTFEVTKNSLFESLRLTSKKADIKMKTAVISPSYEFTGNFGVRMDIKYMYSSFKNRSTSYNNGNLVNGTINEGNSLSLNDYDLNNGYGLALNFQMIYPVEGFNFYLIPGIGVDKFNLKYSKSQNNYSYAYSNYPVTYRYASTYNLDAETDIYSYIFKIETGFSVYVSRYVDLFFLAGVDFHLFSELISDVEISETNTANTGTIPAAQQNMLKNTTMDFKGNFPPEYYVQAGLVLRLF